MEDKYGVHFEYNDLYNRLLEVKANREAKSISPVHTRKSSGLHYRRFSKPIHTESSVKRLYSNRPSYANH